MRTNAAGFYSFGLLRPGLYSIREFQPGSYLDGKDCLGTRGGTLNNDLFTIIELGEGDNGRFYNFAEQVKALSKRKYVARL